MKETVKAIGLLRTKVQRQVMMLLCVVVIPFAGYTQGPPSPGGPSGPGSLPDSPTPPPAAVPFDWRLNLLLIAVGLVFSISIVYKIHGQKTKLQ